MRAGAFVLLAALLVTFAGCATKNKAFKEAKQLLAEGKSMKELAAILDLTPRTVAFHKYRMMEQLRLKTSAELVKFAVREGVIA